MRFFWLTLALASGPAGAAGKSTFVYCSEANPASMNALLGQDVTTQDIARHLFSNLVENARGDTEDVVPGLATEWKVAKDGLRYTFKLRPNVKFHATEYFTPTRALTADDVVFSFERFFKKDHPYHKIGGGAYHLAHGMGFEKLLASVRAVDPHTVEITLNRPFAPFLRWLGVKAVFPVMSKEYGEKLLAAGAPERFDQYPIGSGPFVFQEFVRDSQVVMRANPEYFGGKAGFEKLVFAITPDSAVRVQKILAGECHVAFQPAPADIENMKPGSGVKLVTAPGANIGYLAFNTTKPPFDKREVRRAIALALNRDAYIQAIFRENGERLDGPVPKRSWGNAAPARELRQDLAAAKKLLAEAGLTDGFKTTLFPMAISRIYNPNGKKLAELIQADLAKIGVKTRVEQYEWATFLAKTRVGEFELAQMGWSAFTIDPDMFLYPNLSCESAKTGANRARWCHPEFDRLITRAREAQKESERKKLYAKAQQIFYEELPWVPLASGRVYHLVSEQVKGFTMASDGSVYFYGVSL